MHLSDDDADPRARPLRAVRPGSPQHFLGDLGFAVVQDDGSVRGAMSVTPSLCTPGTRQARSGVLCTLADVVAGRLAARVTAPNLSVTVDLSYVVFHAAPSDRIVAEARVLKSGRTTIVTETRYHPGRGPTDDLRPGGPPFAICTGTFVASGRPSDLLPATPDQAIPIVGTGVPTLEVDALSRLGAVERGPGVLEVVLQPDLTNSAGLLQGGAVALLADGAAQSAASAHADRCCTVDDLEIRFLSALRDGPVRSSVELLADDPTGASTWRVELRDTGRGDRLGTVAVARCRPADSDR